jgi:hypothetical protein
MRLVALGAITQACAMAHSVAKRMQMVNMYDDMYDFNNHLFVASYVSSGFHPDLHT